MDDVRFDELARSFAAGLPRRQLLKLVATGLIGGILPLQRWARLSPSAGAAGNSRIFLPVVQSATPPGVCPSSIVQSNTVTGTCEDLFFRIRSPGVRSADGTWEANAAGVTEVNFRASATILSSATHLSGPQVCVTQEVRISFSGSTTVCMLDWKPSPTPCCPEACAADIARWKRELTNHEQRHVNDANNVVAETNRLAKWSSQTHTFQACAASEDAAVREIQGQLEQAARPQLEAMKAEFDRRRDAFDGSAAGSVPPPNCTTCLVSENPCRECQNGTCGQKPGEPCGDKCCKPGEVCCNGRCQPADGALAAPDQGTCEQQVYCNCNQTCYTDVQECLSACRVSLGCFTGICGPAQPGQC